jgi:threonine/homoserine/homoserine lactone efflux protein
MDVLVTFLMAFAFSFLGSIPPGTLNLSVLQLGLASKIKVAWSFSLAAALVEYPYAWIAIRFEELITRSPFIINNFEYIGAFTMITLGLFQLITLVRKKNQTYAASIVTKNYGFAKGLVLSLLNPLAIPYWIGVTAYLLSQQWIVLDTTAQLHTYLLGVCLGALALFISLAYLAKVIRGDWQHNAWVKAAPGATLLGLGCYALFS